MEVGQRSSVVIARGWGSKWWNEIVMRGEIKAMRGKMSRGTLEESERVCGSGTIYMTIPPPFKPVQLPSGSGFIVASAEPFCPFDAFAAAAEVSFDALSAPDDAVISSCIFLHSAPPSDRKCRFNASMRAKFFLHPSHG